EEKDQQWKRAMDYLSAVSELNYMTQIVIMLYEDNNKVLSETSSSKVGSYRLFSFCPRQSPEMKQSGLGREEMLCCHDNYAQMTVLTGSEWEARVLV
ncbi:hypothetical protein XENOCAPTIV_013465, partial [Xenoophorus captivus]